MSNTKVLYFGGDARLVALIRRALARESLQVEQTSDVRIGVSSLRSRSHTVAIVDWNESGDFNGLQVGQELRAAAPEAGVILCMAARRLPQCWRALPAACDEHVTKPFTSSELLVRLHRVLARNRQPLDVAGAVSSGCLVVDFVRQSIRVDGQEIVLQPLQLRLIGYLIQHTGRCVSHEELRAQVFRVAQNAGSTSIARQICVLRNRLGAAGAVIVTAHGRYGIDISRHTSPS